MAMINEFVVRENILNEVEKLFDDDNIIYEFADTGELIIKYHKVEKETLIESFKEILEKHICH